MQSSGKSSVLESIVGRDFLPRGSGLEFRFLVTVTVAVVVKFFYFYFFGSVWLLRKLKKGVKLKRNVFLWAVKCRKK